MDGYYDHDPGGRSPRRTVVGLAAVLAALCAAFLIGHASHAGTRANADPGTKSPLAGDARHATNNDWCPQRADALDEHGACRGAARAAAPQQRPVIVGYRHDQAGGHAAAGNYTASLYVQTNRTHARELAVLSTIAASPADAERMGPWTSPPRTTRWRSCSMSPPCSPTG
jgi:hypothetical protein